MRWWTAAVDRLYPIWSAGAQDGGADGQGEQDQAQPGAPGDQRQGRPVLVGSEGTSTGSPPGSPSGLAIEA
jgi:hypothetical protein